MTELSLAELIGLRAAGRYRLDVLLASGLLSAVFEAADEAPGADPTVVLVQLRRPWGETDAPPLVELHDHHLLGDGFTLDVYVPGEVATIADAGEPARLLVDHTDATLRAGTPDSTSPALPAPFDTLRFAPDALAAADHDDLVADALAEGDATGDHEALEDEQPDGTLTGDASLAGAGFDGDGHEVTEPGGRLGVSDTALEMPLLVLDRGDG
jgi:hypothetical protein